MFMLLENYRQFLWGKPRGVRIALGLGFPVIFPVYVAFGAVHFTIALVWLGIIERRQVIGAIQDMFSKKGLRASYSSTWPPEEASTPAE